MSRRAASGPRLGMGLDVESSSGPGLGACLISHPTPHFSPLYDLDSCLRHLSHWSRISNRAVLNGLMRQAPGGSPWVLVPPLGLGCVTGQSGLNIVHMFCLGQGGGVTFCWTWLDAAEADGEFSRRSGQFANRPYGGGGSRLGGGVRLREGWVPASAGMTGRVGGWG